MGINAGARKITRFDADERSLIRTPGFLIQRVKLQVIGKDQRIIVVVRRCYEIYPGP